MGYIYSIPQYEKGEDVCFEYKNGSIFKGKIVSVITHYTEKGQAYHIYSIHRPDRLTCSHIGENKIIERV